MNKYGNKTHIMETVGRTWNEILPLYEKLHAVVRFNLQNVYGDRLVKSDGAIPAHLGRISDYNNYLTPSTLTIIMIIIIMIIIILIFFKILQSVGFIQSVVEGSV